jgi:hypothetical protein
VFDNFIIRDVKILKVLCNKIIECCCKATEFMLAAKDELHIIMQFIR